MKDRELKHLNELGLLNDPEIEQLSDGLPLNRERKITIGILLAVAAFTVLDVIEDRIEGASWQHIIAEVCVIVATSLLAWHLHQKSRKPLLQKAERLTNSLVYARADANRWRAQAQSALKGLGEAISREFEAWDLSDAETEVGLMLLKGYSLKEISALRETSEGTVRQQAAAVYQKSGLGGRAELSAYFLEDLLVVPQPNVRE